MTLRPRYRSEEVAELVLAGRLTVVQTVVRYLTNHECDVRDLTNELLTSLASNGRFLGSPRLKNGLIADEYRVYCASDENDWYVKFYVDGQRVVVLLSCWWDGCAH